MIPFEKEITMSTQANNNQNKYNRNSIYSCKSNKLFKKTFKDMTETTKLSLLRTAKASLQWCPLLRRRENDCIFYTDWNFHFSVSYDLKFKRTTEGDDSKIVGFPTLNQFSICFWVQFTDVERGIHNKILKYYNRGADFEVFRIEVYNRQQGMVVDFHVQETR